MEMKWTASHMNAEGQGYFRTVYPETSDMVNYINIVSNISATSLVQVSGERLQDHWSSALISPGNLNFYLRSTFEAHRYNNIYTNF